MEFRKELQAFLASSSTPELQFSDILPHIQVKASEIAKRSEGHAGVILVWRGSCPACIAFKPEMVKLYKEVQKWNDTQKALESSGLARKQGGAGKRNFPVSTRMLTHLQTRCTNPSGSLLWIPQIQTTLTLSEMYATRMHQIAPRLVSPEFRRYC